MNARRELRLVVVLLLVGAAVTLFAAARPWGAAVVDQGARLPVRTVQVTGEDLAPGLRALGLVALAGVVALVATRAWGRLLVGALVLACGVGVVALAVTGTGGAAIRAHLPAGVDARTVSSVTTTAWWVLAGLGGAVVGVAGGLVLWRGRRWATLSSAHQTPAARAPEPPATDKAVWDALDRGEDPTS
ncbi:MAG: hypothetical protein JWN87_395 [Frankiales bacterium]|jgi:uncharacterized membrane protein (TIGR02234 family)|nr:hypothetical protein [Frankiales bacterium]